MKKYQKQRQYKRYNKTKSKSEQRRKANRNQYNPHRSPIPPYLDKSIQNLVSNPVPAPEKLCLLQQTNETLEFFNRLRKSKSINKIKGISFIRMDLTNVKEIDYSTICVLLAIMGDLKSKKIYTRTNLPRDEKCVNHMVDSGLLNVMYDEKGKPFDKTKKSEMLIIEKGSKKLTRSDNIRISQTVERVVKHLTGEQKVNKHLRRVIIEICGNSIEWAQTTKKQWLLGIKYEDDKVIFTITDVGRGIMTSLHKRFAAKVDDILKGRSDIEVLQGAFIKKYGSSSQKENRNRGLPAIRKAFEIGLLEELKVLTNRVILHFENQSNSKDLNKKSEFQGTLYTWVITQNSLNSTI